MKPVKFAFYSFSMILPLVFIWAGIAAGVDQRPITIGILENRQFAYARMMKNSFLQALNGRYECVWPPDSSMAHLVVPATDYSEQKGAEAASQ